MPIFAFVHTLIERRSLLRVAEAAARALRPDEPEVWAVLAVEEPQHFVVRAFIGGRRAPPYGNRIGAPLWKECLVFAIDKATLNAVQLQEPHWQPKLR